jgi:hypothetical protein
LLSFLLSYISTHTFEQTSTQHKAPNPPHRLTTPEYTFKALPIMRFSLALAAVCISLTTALPTKRALTAPFNNDAGEGLIPSIGQGVDTLFNVGGGLVAEGVRSGDDSGDVSKRALVAPLNNDAGEGLIPSVGQAVDTGFNVIGGLVAEGVRSGGNSDAE